MINGRLQACNKAGLTKKKKLITATYPEAQGLQVQVAQRDGDGKGGGVITAPATQWLTTPASTFTLY